MDQIISDLADIDLQTLEPHNFSNKQKERYFQMQTHQLMEQPQASEDIQLAFS